MENNTEFQYYQLITPDGIIDIDQTKIISTEEKKVAKFHNLYHYKGPVKIYNNIVGRVDEYIHANSEKQALYLLQRKYVKEHPKIPYVYNAWFDRRYLYDENSENKALS